MCFANPWCTTEFSHFPKSNSTTKQVIQLLREADDWLVALSPLQQIQCCHIGIMFLVRVTYKLQQFHSFLCINTKL